MARTILKPLRILFTTKFLISSRPTTCKSYGVMTCESVSWHVSMSSSTWIHPSRTSSHIFLQLKLKRIFYSSAPLFSHRFFIFFFSSFAIIFLFFLLFFLSFSTFFFLSFFSIVFFLSFFSIVFFLFLSITLPYYSSDFFLSFFRFYCFFYFSSSLLSCFLSFIKCIPRFFSHYDQFFHVF